MLCQINYFADVNVNDNLQKIIRCLPDHLIEKWKNVATDIREKSEIPQLEHISNFVRKRVKVEFDPDFSDVLKMDTLRNAGFRREDRRGILSNTKTPRKLPKCYICQAEHRVHDCPTMAEGLLEERIQHAKNHHLCFSCLVRGHLTRECRSRNKCSKNGCTRIHHPLLHTDPPTNSGVASILDKGSIMPVVRVQFKAAKGNVREQMGISPKCTYRSSYRKETLMFIDSCGEISRPRNSPPSTSCREWPLATNHRPTWPVMSCWTSLKKMRVSIPMLL